MTRATKSTTLRRHCQPKHTRRLLLGVDKYTFTGNKRGTEFATPSGGQIGALGIRIPPTLTFTTLPALAK
jgi:hypothetical protein